MQGDMFRKDGRFVFTHPPSLRLSSFGSSHLSGKVMAGHQTSSPPTSTTSASTRPWCFVCLLPPRGPASSRLSANLSSRRPRNTLLLFCSDLAFDNVGTALHVWIKESDEYPGPWLGSPFVDKCSPWKCDSERNGCGGNLAATTCNGWSPRQTIPPVCAPRQMTMRLKAWLAQYRPPFTIYFPGSKNWQQPT